MSTRVAQKSDICDQKKVSVTNLSTLKERHFETLNIKRKARPFSKSFVSPHCEKKKKKNTLIKNNT